jgi:hypothetical protein
MLRRLLDVTPETVADLDLAAEQRYWEGCELITQGYPLGGIYLLGHAAEMILKHACFRTDRGRPADPAAGFFGPIRTWMRLRHPAIDREGYHSLLFWAFYLRDKRRENGIPLPDALDWELVRRARRLYSTWSVGLRYRDWITRAASEAPRVYDDVTWLRDTRVRLWS